MISYRIGQVENRRHGYCGSMIEFIGGILGAGLENKNTYAFSESATIVSSKLSNGQGFLVALTVPGMKREHITTGRTGVGKLGFNSKRNCKRR